MTAIRSPASRAGNESSRKDKPQHPLRRTRAQQEAARTRTNVFWIVIGLMALTFILNSLFALNVLTVDETSTKTGPLAGRGPLAAGAGEKGMPLVRRHRRRAMDSAGHKGHHGHHGHGKGGNHGDGDGVLVPLDIPNIVDPAWYLGDELDDFNTRVYDFDNSNMEGIKKLHALRNLKVKRFFNGICGYYRFNITQLPDISVIVTVQNEQPRLLSITVHSILARTPPELLKEIIIVDDNGIPADIRGTGVNETEFAELKSLSPKVIVLQNQERDGCARSRMVGARRATGAVLVFVDSHIEMLSGTWAQHLLVPIVENPHTLSLQTLDIMDDRGNHTYKDPGEMLYGSISEKFLFTYQGKRWEGEFHEESPTKRLPYETPFGPGSLFAVRRDEFWRLGGYDKGLYVWGGENTELALKIWSCGGRMVMVPCSRVGHMYRIHIKDTGRWPPDLPLELTDKLGLGHPGKFVVYGAPADNFTKVVVRNNLRIMNMWVGDHPAKRGYYKEVFGTEELPPEWKQYEDEMKTDPAALEQLELKKKNQCKDFEWFDKYVFKRLLGKHHPWHPSRPKKVSCGSHKAEGCKNCPRGRGAEWCHGDCRWCPENKSCVAKNDPKACFKPKAKKPVTKKPDKLSISVVLPCGFEHETYVRTVKSVFEATPPDVLLETIVVDDASDPPLEPGFPDAAKYKAKFVRNEEAQGLIGAKYVGAMAAKGDILVFFDCHVKPAENYWVPFVNEIKENYKRVVIPTITALNVETWEEFNRPAPGKGGMSKCYLTFDGQFKWTNDDTRFVPIMSGGLLAISKKWFIETGGYDTGMKGWGGENLDQSLRIWTCGGEIVTAPESYVAHMWRDDKHKAKYRLNPGDPALNRARAMKAHTGPWFEKTVSFPAFAQFNPKHGNGRLNSDSITDVLRKNRCETFEWYLDRFAYIYRDAGVLPTEIFQIESLTRPTGADKDADQSLCLELKGHNYWDNGGAPTDELTVAPCKTISRPDNLSDGTQLWHGSNRRDDGSCCSTLRVWNTDQCLNEGLRTNVCSLQPNMKAELTSSGLLKIGKQCATLTEQGNLVLQSCDNASRWFKRGTFRPLEFRLLNTSMQSDWLSHYRRQ